VLWDTIENLFFRLHKYARPFLRAEFCAGFLFSGVKEKGVTRNNYRVEKGPTGTLYT
jgi:hypothetical protein